MYFIVNTINLDRLLLCIVFAAEGKCLLNHVFGSHGTFKDFF